MGDVRDLAAQRETVRQLLAGTAFVAVDVGARGDIPAHWLPLDGVARIAAFEPDPEACRRLRATYDARGHGEMYHVAQVAVAGATGTRLLHMPRSRGGSSLFAVDHPIMHAYVDADYLLPIESSRLEVVHAGEAFDALPWRPPHLLKLDIQGAELEVLQALSPATLAQVQGIELEASMIRREGGPPTFADCHAFLAGQGFTLLDMRPQRVLQTRNGSRRAYSEGVFGVHDRSASLSRRLWEADVLYIRETVADEAALRRLCVCLALYGFFAEAHTALETAADGLSPSFDRAAALTTVQRWHGAARRRWRDRTGGPQRLYRWLYRYLDLEDQPPWWPN